MKFVGKDIQTLQPEQDTDTLFSCDSDLDPMTLDHSP